ncbi:MAG: DUF2497 domain-containing protein, partial [Rickettsiales bacterium]|nr:DUF2497 domain-containing protein [Rickettsiales bacterium]
MVEERASDENNPTMEEILQTIRGVIAGEENPEDQTETKTSSAMDDVLSDIIDAPAATPKDEPSPAPANVMEAADDLMPDLDELIDDDEDEDVLELTELADDEPAIDVLDEIDEAIGADDAPPKPTVSLDDVDLNDMSFDDIPEGNDFAMEEPTPEPVVDVQAEPSVPESQPDPDLNEALASLQNATPMPAQEGLISHESASLSSQALQDLVNKVPRTGPGFRSGLMLEDLVIEAMKPYLKAWLDENLPDLVKKLV